MLFVFLKIKESIARHSYFSEDVGFGMIVAYVKCVLIRV